MNDWRDLIPGNTNGASCNFLSFCICLCCLNILLVHGISHYFFFKIQCNYIYLEERREEKGQKEGHKLVRGMTDCLRMVVIWISLLDSHTYVQRVDRTVSLL